MKILFVCDYFEPINKIGAKRPTEFATCLRNLGDQITVITFDSSNWEHNAKIKSDFPVYRINIDNNRYFRFYNFLKKLRKKKNNDSVKYSLVTQNSCKNKFLKKLKNFYRSFLNIIFGNCGRKAILHFIKFKNIEFDTLYTTYGGFSSLLVGEKLKKKNESLKWIVDIRDAVFYKRTNTFFIHYYKSFLKKHCYKCDYFVFASRGYQIDSHIDNDKFKGKQIVIENGFTSFIETKRESNSCMNLLYSGSLYDDRHFDSIFSSLKELKKEFERLKIIVSFYGDNHSFEQFLKEANKYEVGELIIYKGFVDKEKMEAGFLDADCFLISSWNFSDYSGVLPGKLFEYMAYQKPIFGHVSGDFPNSLIKNIINGSYLGFCADECEKSDYSKMYKIIRDCYIDFLKTGYCHLNSNFKNESLKKYIRMNQVKQLRNFIK